MPTHRSFAVVLDPPAEPPKCCTNKSSITLPADVGEKFRQSVQYGSQEWRDLYQPLRPMMEGLNGFA